MKQLNWDLERPLKCIEVPISSVKKSIQDWKGGKILQQATDMDFRSSPTLLVFNFLSYKMETNQMSCKFPSSSKNLSRYGKLSWHLSFLN